MTVGLLLAAVIIIVCIASSRLSGKLGVPALLIFIVLGMLFGSDGVFKIPFDNYNFAEQICSVALIFIMFYGGFGTNWKMAKPVIGKAVALSTLGVVITALLTGLFCYYVVGFSFLESMLIGAVISSTDAASVFSVLRSKKLNLKNNTASLLEVESGSNDPAAYMLTMIILTIMEGKGADTILYMVFAQVIFGVLFGAGLALLSVFVLRRRWFSSDGLDAMFVLAMAVLSYALPSLVGGNGYLSVYIAGMILGNSRIKNKVPLVHFFDGITGLSQIVIFFLLGLLAFPSQIPQILLPSILIALFLTFIARPAAVFLILTPVRAPLRQQLLVSWSGLRGAAAIVFAIMATVSKAYTKTDVFHIAFCVALLSVAFQGTLLPLIAKKLSMVDAESNVFKTFNDYQEEVDVQLIKTKVPQGHPWEGKTIGQLNLVADTLVVMIRRGDEQIVPNGNTVITAGDTLVISGAVYRDDKISRLTEMTVDHGDPWEGKTIRDISLPEHALIILVKKENGKTVVPNGTTKIHSGDILVLSGYDE